MDRYRSLYKENSSILSPTQHSKTNRELQNANRAKKRREMYENIRKISVSPTPRKAIPAKECNDGIKDRKVLEFQNKENREVEEYKQIVKCDETKVIDQNETNKSRIALVATRKGNTEKSTRQEAYLLRFIQWKEAHKLKEQQKKLEPKKRPFVPCGGVGGSTFGDTGRPITKETSKVKSKEVATFVPKDHNKFKPPAGLKTTLSKMTSAAKSVINNDRKSFYSVVPTPPRNKQENSINVSKPLVLTKATVISNLNKTPATTTKTITKLANVNSAKVMKIPSTIKNTDAKITAAVASGKKPSGTAPVNSGALCDPLKKTSAPPNKNGEGAAKPILNRLNNVAKFARPQPITRKPIAHPKPIGTHTNANIPKSSTSAGTNGAVGKAHLLQSKKALAEVRERQKFQRPAKLATSFKSTKVQVFKFNRSNAPNKITVKGKTLLGGKRTCTADAAFAIAETPTDLLNVNPFEAFVTSTRIKSLSPHTTKTPNISPINTKVGDTNADAATQKTIRAHSSTTAKRALLQNEVKKASKLQTEKHKFNFIRYSCGRPESDMSGINEQIELSTVDGMKETAEATACNQTQQNTILEVKPKQSVNEDNKTDMKIDKTLSQHETPKSNEQERPVNYISSFVSVSRGKVSARKEREKRDSIYLPSADDSLAILNAVKTNKTEIPTTVGTPRSVEARRILEAVRYFRQQLQNEIDRLHTLCDQWDKYKEENLPLLQKAGGEDMINVTIGQTKLLTSKKFQQFKGLIDRCEDGAKGTAAVDDGSEATKPITDVDLEGFWSMLNLQVDNVEKRFENLTRWKDNNWNDPDDVQEIKQPKTKTKPNLNKVKKTKAPAKPAKASLGLQAMLRKMHAEMRKKKENIEGNAEATMDVPTILTPTRQRHRRSQSGTPKIGNSGDERRNSTPRRISVVVRDRKSHSAAATVISLPVKSQAISAAAAAQRRLSRIAVESPNSIRACGNELRRSLNGMEKAFGGCNELLRNALAVSAHKSRRRSGTPNFIELPIDSEPPLVAKMPTPAKTPPPTQAINIGRKSILKTPGTAKGKPKNVIFNEKLSVKKFKFTIEDDEELSESEEPQLQTSTEEAITDQRTYSLRTRKVVLRPSSEFEIPKA